jgi:hypothetical protein
MKTGGNISIWIGQVNAKMVQQNIELLRIGRKKSDSGWPL